MDDVDHANEHVEREAAYRLAQRKPVPARATGHCIFCGDPCRGKVFCNTDCRDDYEKSERLRANNSG